MLVRIILLILLFKYHQQIYNFFILHNLFSVEGIKDKFQDSIDKVSKIVSSNELNQQMLKLKQLDRRSHIEVKKRIRNIDSIYKTINNNKDTSLRNDYQTIKDERKKIKNKINSIVINKGFQSQLEKIISVIDQYIEAILHNILEIRNRRGINTEWFEGTLYEPVVSYDPQSNYHYDYFV